MLGALGEQVSWYQATLLILSRCARSPFRGHSQVYCLPCNLLCDATYQMKLQYPRSKQLHEKIPLSNMGSVVICRSYLPLFKVQFSCKCVAAVIFDQPWTAQVKLQSQPKVGPGETPLYNGAFDATRKVISASCLLIRCQLSSRACLRTFLMWLGGVLACGVMRSPYMQFADLAGCPSVLWVFVLYYSTIESGSSSPLMDSFKQCSALMQCNTFQLSQVQ